MKKEPPPTWDARLSPAGNARSRLPGLVRDYFTAGRELAAGTPAPPDLHAFRLRTKRLRYSLELFRTCYGPGLNKRLEDLRMVQQFLGEINDCAASLRLMPAMRAYLEKLSAKRIAAFAAYWEQEFDKPGKQKSWERYLGRAQTAGTGK